MKAFLLLSLACCACAVLATSDGYPPSMTLMELEAGIATMDSQEWREILNGVDQEVVEEFVEQWSMVEYSETPGCIACENFAFLLKNISDGTWESIREVAVGTCETIFLILSPSLNATRNCVMIMALQGPHFHRVIYESEPTELCENLNACIPPAPEVSHVRTEPNANKSPENKMNKKKEKKKKRFFRKSHSTINTLKVAHLTDIHIDLHYMEDTETDCGMLVCCREEYGPGPAGAYGDYGCSMPARTVELFIDHIRDQQPDILVYSGDTPPHHIWDESLEGQLNCTRAVIMLLERLLPNTTVYPNLGNHETFPTNIMYFPLNDTQTVFSEYAEIWQPLAGFEEEQKVTMREAGYYTILYRDNLRIMSLNTNFGYTLNWYNTLNFREPQIDRMRQWAEDTLRDAAANDEKVILLTHQPAGRYDHISSVGRWFHNLILQYHDTIVLQVAGHTHRDEHKLFVDPEDGVAKSMVYTAPALSSNGFKNPSWRIFELDGTTYTVQDYLQYGLDMRDTYQRRLQIPEIKLRHRVSEEYDLSDLSPQSWMALTSRMEADDALLQRYHYNRDTQRSNDTCDEDCKRETICFVRTALYPAFVDCMAPTNDTTILAMESDSSEMEDSAVVLAEDVSTPPSGVAACAQVSALALGIPILLRGLLAF